MDFEQLRRIVEELSRILAGFRVERVYEDVAGGIHMFLHREGARYILLLSPDRAMPRMHLVSVKPASVDTPHIFVQLLRSRLSGMRLVDVRLLNEDRVVELRFAKQDRQIVLIFELFGSAANLVLTDQSSVILSVYFPVPISMHSKRLLAPGAHYTPPEHGSNKRSALAAERINDKPESGGKEPSANRESEQKYDRLYEQKLIVLLRTKLSTLIKKNIVKAERKIAALSRELDSAEKAQAYRSAGEIILANMKRIAPGDTLVTLTGYDGGVLTVSLDPALSPSDNAARYFKKYKKGKTGRVIIKKRLADAEAEVSMLKEQQAGLERAGDAETLVVMHSGLEARGVVRRTDSGKQKSRTPPPAPAFRTINHQGWEILVGKSAAGNDHITMKIARPDDLWLHAEGMPGSHVLVRNPLCADIPPDVLLKAANLAAYYSRGREAGKVSVTFTQARFVQKPRGAKAGAVILSERKSVMATPNAKE